LWLRPCSTAVTDNALHETMRAYSSAAGDLLDEIVAIGHRYKGSEFPVADIVHFDLNPGNVLVQGRKVVGVVDWEGTRSGDKAFDIATLLFYAHRNPEIEAKLWTALLDLAGVPRASVYLAHMMLRQVEWSARYHWPATVQMYLRRSALILSKLKELQ
jgi:thiamine kinase-like enzyme